MMNVPLAETGDGERGTTGDLAYGRYQQIILKNRKRSVNLSITHIFSAHQEPNLNISKPGHAAPHDSISGWAITVAIQIAAKLCELNQT